ncbi:MAG: hypothetical protein HQ500_02810 [Flavobacteriales bacterium]|nr:hypothetical protein [Flavobacteriales bacterium]
MLKSFVYANLLVATVLASLTLSSFFLIDYLYFRWYVPVSVFLGSFVLYTFHRLYKIDFIPAQQLAERHQWVLKHAQPMKYAMSFAVFGLMLLLPNFNADTVVWLVPAGLISVGYTIPILPSQNGWRRFRDIPLTKPLIIALVVSYITLGFPVFEQMGIQALFEPGFIQRFTERFLFLIVVTIPFDLRDILNDRDAGIHTLGTEFGFKRSRLVGYVIIAAWLISMLMLYFFTASGIGSQLASGLILGFVTAAYASMKPAWDEIKFILVFEGAVLVYAVLYSMGASDQIIAWIQPL